VQSTEDLVDVVAALAHANGELVSATAAGDADAVTQLMTDIAGLEKRRNRIIHRRAQVASVATYQTSIPVRDRVIQTLDLGEHPLATRLLAEIAGARFDETINTQALASLRRDELRSWRSAHEEPSRAAPRDVYIVPALTYDRYTPVRGSLALSTWPLDVRLIAPASPRVDLLHVTIALASEVLSSPDAPYEASLRRLVTRLGRSVKGLTSTLVDDPARIRDAAGSELDQLVKPDDRERAEAAERAEAQLTDQELLFGTVVTRAEGRASAGGTR
jgi:hypothetical protein